MTPCDDDLTHLRAVARVLHSDPFFRDAVDQLAWRVLDTEETLTPDERNAYIVALVLKMRAEFSNCAIEYRADLTERELIEITDAAMIAALDLVKKERSAPPRIH